AVYTLFYYSSLISSVLKCSYVHLDNMLSTLYFLKAKNRRCVLQTHFQYDEFVIVLLALCPNHFALPLKSSQKIFFADQPHMAYKNVSNVRDHVLPTIFLPKLLGETLQYYHVNVTPVRPN